MPDDKAEKPKKKPPKKKPPAEPQFGPIPAAVEVNVALYHPTGILTTLRFMADSPAEAARGVGFLIAAGFTERRPFEVEPTPVTPEQAQAAARAAAAMAEAVAKAPAGPGTAFKDAQVPAGNGPPPKRDTSADPALEKPKANMEKAVAKAEGRPDAAEKERVKKLLAWWKDFLFVKDGGPNAEAATRETRRLKAEEPASVVLYIKEKALDKWAAETGFEWDRDRQEWVAPKEPEEPIEW